MGGRRRGRLTVYLGAAPGVGKTYAMLDEARRRRERGTDVVVGYVETHGRQHTAAMLHGLELVPRRTVVHRGSSFTEMDTDAILARAPEVVCVDELAHSNVPGTLREKRVQDVEVLRRAGIEVVTTVNIQHLESLNDEVERITGVRQQETVPDELVRTADQIHLVDMPPDALRRRMAHGNVYRADQVDASLTSYFRVGNLTALRQLALLWLADRVDDALGEYRRDHGIGELWPAKERIVVAVSGDRGSEALLRRGSRLAHRSAGGELLAVHVIVDDGMRRTGDRDVGRLHRLVTDLGGSYHPVVGSSVAEAVLDFATGTNATVVLVGTSTRGWFRRRVWGTTGERIAEKAGELDVLLVNHTPSGQPARPRWYASPLGRSRQLVGLALALLLPAVLVLGLELWDEPERLPLDLLLFLAATVLVALVGGLVPALLAALAAFVLMSWFSTRPFNRFVIDEPSNVVALLVFVAVAVGVASVVDRASRRATEATRARTEAVTLGTLARSVLTGQDTATALVDRLREMFAQRSVALLERGTAGWDTVAASGEDPAHVPEEGATLLEVDDRHVLVLRGDALPATDRRVLEGFAVQVGLVLEYSRLREREARAAALEGAQSTSTALLRAVSHDLRTPLATARTAVDGLERPALTPEDRAELLHSVRISTDELERLIDNLLDLSRIDAGLVLPRLSLRSLEEILPLAVSGHAAATVALEVDESMPWVLTDAGLLERIVANLVDNAVKASAGQPVRVLAHARPEWVEIMVVDRGPGVPPARRERMFEPFQRLDDLSPGGVGLGLAVARGLAGALGGTLEAEDTPGGGLTMVVTVPRAADEHGTERS